MEETLEDADRDTDAGMHRVIHVITLVDVHDVNSIRVAPTNRPRIDESERVATILEAPMIVLALIDVEPVLAAKTGRVMGVRNTAMRGIALVSACSL